MTNMTADPAELSAIAPPGVLARTQDTVGLFTVTVRRGK